ncbi:MAG: hypothetical protein GFGODING_00139 [Flavobacteriales bacterium]|nr:hypothetical protein [Flavobacteriales bacterium]
MAIFTRMKDLVRGLPVLLLPLLLCACGQRELARYRERMMEGGCTPWLPEGPAARAAIAPLDSTTVPDAVRARFSANSLRMAHAIGVLPELPAYIAQQATRPEQRTVEQRLAALELKDRIADRCDRASLEISALASELDCEEEKVSQLADLLNAIGSRRETRLTIAAIAVGATGAVVTGIHLLDEDGTSNIDGAGIVFGIAEAALGAAILLDGARTELRHPRNALRAVHEGSDPDGIFPPSVWYCLVQPRAVAGGRRSLRQELLERWGAGEGTVPEGDLALCLGEGGRYDAGQLETRGDMFDQLEASIKLVKQDLLQLVQELEAVGR